MTKEHTPLNTNEQIPLSRSEQKRAQILESAIELFCHQGFPHTSMDEVAKHAGVSKQTVYAHFGSKDDLFVSAIESKCVVHQLTDNALIDASRPQQVMLLFAQQFGEMIVSKEAMTVFKTCVAQAETHPEVSRLFYDAGPKHVLGLIRNYLKKVNELGEYFFENPHESAVRLCLMLFGELKLRLELGLEIEDLHATRQQYLQDTAEMFLRAHKVGVK
ncbi:TetR/AcrR family transcriptional regulator [Shewanella livingstonensis]|uniref:TetR/AcrR family transcriptional regulator n=1 Tax=Shewanella livingstonensis TaxID=150120 RepID=A0A3G8LSN3_9GAMM|nr:TetR/AcrR family transcriptional regulator [Shewanella livingstonensis]AZG72626.1 TetR/AcrR family transcriptional regulator [Shewanella livingstonensis]